MKIEKPVLNKMVAATIVSFSGMRYYSNKQERKFFDNLYSLKKNQAGFLPFAIPFLIK